MSDYREEKAKAARQCTKSLRELMLGYKALLEDALREEGLSLPQLRLLHAVQEHGGVSGAAIARSCQVTPQTLQAMLTRAVREKWVVREASEHNHRILTPSLTAKGRRLLERGLAAAGEVEATIWAGVSMSDIEQMNAVLSRGLANVHEQPGREASDSRAN